MSQRPSSNAWTLFKIEKQLHIFGVDFFVLASETHSGHLLFLDSRSMSLSVVSTWCPFGQLQTIGAFFEVYSGETTLQPIDLAKSLQESMECLILALGSFFFFTRATWAGRNAIISISCGIVLFEMFACHFELVAVFTFKFHLILDV